MHAVFTDEQLADLGDKKTKNTIYACIFGVRISARNANFDVSQNLKSQYYPFFLKFLICPKTYSPEK